MQYIVIIQRTGEVEVLDTVGHWSRDVHAQSWIDENRKPGYDYTITKMWHPNLYE